MNNPLFRLHALFSVFFKILCFALLLIKAPQAGADAHIHEEFAWETLPVHTLFENHGAPMMLVDPETGVVLHGNRAAREFYGYSDLRGMNIHSINTLSPQEIHTEMERARSRKKNHFNFLHRLADGSVRNVEVYSYSVPVGGKDVLYTVRAGGDMAPSSRRH
jgi:PAS domain S-box-containing protein